MRIATWNVNSLKVRLPHVLAWLKRHAPDILCLQETKLEDGKFPVDEIAAAGYRAIYSGQKTYNGVAMLSRETCDGIVAAVPGFDDAQKRVLAASVCGIRVVCVYVPNGESVESDKYRYKLSWLAALNAWLESELTRFSRLAVLGDLNIAEPKALIGFAGPRVIEQTIRQTLPEGFQRSEFLVEHGMVDLITPRAEMKPAIGRFLRIFMNK